QLEQAEANALADGVRGVARHYTWLSGVSERGQDWFNLFMITGVIVGARWNNPNAASKTTAQQGTVVQFPQKQPPPTVPTVSAVGQAAVTQSAPVSQPDPSPTNAVNLTMDDLYHVEIPSHDGPMQ